ncbi:acyl-CoA dehydrogenase family protein [Geobacter hydrogenophilus]|uniref:Acyl-CoA dehydrogenase n=1 Tax=Geobacter hydrogenophilus TaxID=40983 RepID=A0A9W6G2L7_9BACT|nr:acyl-CoA dehydrogenase family protein [Geobacter hydrogenophilus]MBT0894479.1 acyl-CoA dehydrogenase family protein [Geobacter hydrogenophilus]GLI39366.1 acyl-CoA dehydrogenase [Geobacter hydrogenophilus]
MNGNLLNGGEFLLADTAGMEIFSPEEFTAEQKQIAETTEEFMKKEVFPNIDRIEDKDFGFVVEKMRQCADLGLFLAEVPEEYGGLELEKTTNMLMIEKVAPAASFNMAFSGHTGIGILPMVYYGTPDQKERYLGKLSSGEWIGAYALTEPDCGSDPLSSRTTAVLSDDGRHYILNGTKQFITNSAFADLFTVFAKIDGKHFSAFLVEKGYEGFSVGAEEKKMGLKGSSTTQLVLDNVRVPVENLLGEAGKGHKIAFNVLNVGRLKVATSTLGMAKGAFAEAASYATERKQFGKPIGTFGAIQEKLADMVAAIYASETVVYRVAGLLDSRLATLERDGDDYYERYQRAIEEYAAECAIAKVFCSEQLDMVVDEAVQIHGGYGYISEYAVERYYRDSRIQRIFEGTNEINRILIPTMLLRKADNNGSTLWELVRKAQAGVATETACTGEFAMAAASIARLKQLFLTVLGAAAPAKEHQEVMLAVADMIIAIFALESAVLRADKTIAAASMSKQDLLRAVVTVLVFELSNRFQSAATRCCAYALKGEELIELLKRVATLTACPAEGLLVAKHKLADAAKDVGRYSL